MKTITINRLKRIYSGLTIILIITIWRTLSSLYELIMLLLKGKPLTYLWGLSVNLFRTNNNLLASSNHRIYLTDLSGTLLFFDPSLSVKLFSGIYPIIIWACISYIFYLTIRIVRTTLDGNPFVIQNAKRLRIIGSLITLTPIVLYYSQAIFVAFLIRSVRIDNVSLSTNNGHDYIQFMGIIPGVLIILLTSVFQLSIKLKEENELTV